MAPASPGVIAGTDDAPGRHNPLRDPRDRRIPRVAGPCVLVMFGVTGDLARKKLMPAIYDLANRGLLPPGFSFVGFARRDWENEDFAQLTYQAVKEYARTPFRDAVWQQLSEGVRFVSGSFDDDAAFDELAATVMQLDAERGTGGNYAFYLSIPPGQFPTVVRQLKRSGLSDTHQLHSVGHRHLQRQFVRTRRYSFRIDVREPLGREARQLHRRPANRQRRLLRFDPVLEVAVLHFHVDRAKLAVGNRLRHVDFRVDMAGGKSQRRIGRIDINRTLGI